MARNLQEILAANLRSRKWPRHRFIARNVALSLRGKCSRIFQRMLKFIQTSVPKTQLPRNRSSRKFDAMFTKRASLKLFPVPSYSMSAETPAAHTFTFEKQGFWPLKVRIKTNEVRMWVSTFGPGGQILRVDDRSFCRLIRWDLRESWSVCIHKNSGILGLVTFNEHGAIFHLLSNFGASPKVLLKQITMSDLHLKCPDIASQGWYWFVQ